MTDDRLDPLLDAWAASQRLDRSEADRMLDAILATSPATVPLAAAPGSVPSVLPATWWAQMTSQVTSAVVLAARGPDLAHGGGSQAA